jgi:WD40 repeat protein
MKTLLFACLFLWASFSVRSQNLALQFPISHSGLSITNAMYSNDGTLLLTQQDGDRAYLWDAYSNKLIKEWKGVRKSAFSNDGNLILLVYPTKVVVLLTATLQTIISIKSEENKNTEDAFLTNQNKNINIITTSGWPATTQVVSTDLNNGQQTFSLNLQISLPKASVNNNGSLFAIANFDSKETVVYNASTGLPAYKVAHDNNAITNLLFSPDDKWLAGISGNSIVIWDAKNGSLHKVIKAHQAAVSEINFSNNSNQLVSGSMDKSARIWNVYSGKLVQEFKEEKEIQNISFTKKDNFLLVGFESFGMCVWDIKKGTRHTNLYTGMAQYKNKYQVSPDEKLVFASMYGGAKIHKLFNGEEVYEFVAFTDEIQQVKLSTDKKMLLSLNGQNGIEVWDLMNGKLLAGIGMPDTMRYSTYFKDAVFSADNKFIIAAFHNGEIAQWDIASGKFTGNYISPKNGDILQVKLSSKKNRLLVTAKNGVSLYQLQPLKELFNFKKESLEIAGAGLNKSETQVVVNSLKNDAFVLNAEDGTMLCNIKKNDYAGNALFCEEDKKLLIVTGNAYAVVYNPMNGNEITKLKTWPGNFNPEGGGISPDGNVLYVSTGSAFIEEQRSIELYDVHTGKLIKSFPGAFFKSIYFINNNECIIASEDEIEKRKLSDFSLIQKANGRDFIVDESNNRLFIKNKYAADVYSLDQFKKQISYIGMGKTDGPKFQSLGGITILTSGYYMGNKEAVSKLHYLKGLQPVGFEQLDILYNRPDKVLEFLGSDAVVTNASKSAYYKRIKKLGIDSSALTNHYSVPVADFDNREAINAEQEKDQLTLQIKAGDSLTLLSHYNVWVNEVPVYGSAGIDLKDKKLKKLDTKITLTLCRGTNKIETSVTNANGIESYKLPLYVYQGSAKGADKFGGYQAYDPNKKIDEYLYFIGIGINRFAEGKNNLQWSVKDIRDLAIHLKEKYGDAIKMDTLFDEQVTVENIKALKQKLLKSNVNDKVIIAYSGHGLLSKNFDYYLSTYPINFQQPENAGLAYEELENLMNGIPARKKLMLIDACHSGEVDKEEMEKLKMMAVSDTSKTKGAKGVEPLFNPGTKKLGMKNSFVLMQELFVNVGRSTGATVISAAGGTQFALERGDLKNGVFTYSILEFMKVHATAHISELKEYVNRRVPELTKGLQVPTSRTETNRIDWKVW